MDFNKFTGEELIKQYLVLNKEIQKAQYSIKHCEDLKAQIKEQELFNATTEEQRAQIYNLFHNKN